MATLRSFFVLLLFQFAGEILRTLLHIPIPGPVIGMVLLATWYIIRKREPSAATQRTADTLLGWLGLLFVPAGAGIVANFALLRSAWLPVSIALLGSTLLTLITTAWVMQRLARTRA